MKNSRVFKRMAGFFRARFPALGLGGIPDPRSRRGLRWKNLGSILKTTIIGIMAGCKSVADVERLTAELSAIMGRELGISRRLPDTTLRDILIRLSPENLREVIRASARDAFRRKALKLDGLPFHVVAMDGKSVTLPSWDKKYCQRHHHKKSGAVFGMLRTVTFCLSSARGRPCLDTIPIPAETNEMGHFKRAFVELNQHFGRHFQVITYDAGASSRDNAKQVVAAGKDFVFALKKDQPQMYGWARELLGSSSGCSAESIDVVTNDKTVRRRLYIVEQRPTRKNLLCWADARSLIRVETITECGGTMTFENRFFVSSMPPLALTGDEWLLLIRRHWAVENNCHGTFDMALDEDGHPWIKDDPMGALAVLLLRRVAYNLITLFRSVTLRSEDNHNRRMKDIMRWVYNTLIAASKNDLAGLRIRKALPAGR